MRKRFNVTGTCIPDRHYMVNTKQRFAAVVDYIDAGEYFSINRARQFGKTTLLDMIWRNLSDRYLVIGISFEGVGETAFSSEANFVRMVSGRIVDCLCEIEKRQDLASVFENAEINDLDALSRVVSTFTAASEKPVILTIDEVDKSADNQLFLNFLGMLRNMYLDRARKGMNATFHNVILAGVYDIKNLKLKIRPDAEKKYNSPWNVAADFTVDMTFHPQEIAQMLEEYENDLRTGMDIKAVSEEIYRYTSGYPVLVSYICKFIDERLDKHWSSDGIKEAVKIILRGESTLMDDLSKNLENDPDLRSFIYNIAVNGADYTYTAVDPMVKYASLFSYIKDVGGKVRIHNTIFEEAIYLYFTVAYQRENASKLSPFQLNYIVNGHLNMEYALSRFAVMMREEYRVEDGDFLERQGRLVFLSFLKPIINGTGFYYVEPQTRDNKRMDLIVTYGEDEFIIELKLWHGEKYEQSGRDQLSAYLDVRGKEEGYLVTFDFTKNKKARDPEWLEMNGKRIFEVVI